jgi:Na+-driven multidrug efflux pump
MARLTWRVLLAGGLSGVAAGLAFQLGAPAVVAAFTADPAVAAALRGGGAWAVLAAAQPLNGLLFVFDGLLLATQRFRFIRDYMCLGFAALFCPLLALGGWLRPSLAAIWAAKAALNVWRLAGAAYLIYWRFLPRFGDDLGAAEGEEAVEGGGGDDPKP